MRSSNGSDSERVRRSAGPRTDGSSSGDRSGARTAAPATCGKICAPSRTAAAEYSRSSRHSSGAASNCSIANVTGRPISAESRRIQSISRSGPAMSSPAAPARRDLEDPAPELAEHAPDAEQLVLGGERAGHRLAVDRAVHDRARGREAERAGRDALAHELRHRARCRPASPARSSRRARPSRRRARRRAAPACRRRRDAAPLERVEVLGEALPLPARCPRPAPRRGCPRRPPSARSASRAGPGAPARSRRRSCPSRASSRRASDDGASCGSQVACPS